MIRLISRLFTPCVLLFLPAVSSATTRALNPHPVSNLVAPAFDFENRPTYKPCGNEIVFRYANVNEGAGTEIWRSRSADSGFELVALKHGEDVFIDQNLTSNKTYYYKLRAVKDDGASVFSEVAGFESGASWFDPALSLTLLDNQTVEGKITDRSFLEYNYQISFRMEGGAVEELYDNIMLSDSGQTFTFTHASLEPGKTYIYSVDATLGWSCGSRLYSNVAVDTITIPGSGTEDLLAPEFLDVWPGTDPCGNEIAFVISNKNPDADTELWRSRSRDSGFQLIDVAGGPYLDDSLASRKEYYYKLRAVSATDTSAFSDTRKFSSGPKWFEPTLELTVLPDMTVQGTFTDRSYLDDFYDFSRSGDGRSNLFHAGVALPDSGQVFTFIDTAVHAGGTYTYHLDLYFCRANMRSDILVKSITIPGGDEVLQAPAFVDVGSGIEPCGNEIVFVFENDNADARTEVWRSRQRNSGFELVKVLEHAGTYLDDSLESGKDYYYKLRAVNASDTSAFSETMMSSSGPAWFEPTLELTVLPDNTVQGTLTDRSYLDDTYDFSRSGDGNSNLFHASVALSDSGRVYSFIDTAVQVGGTYTYHVDLYHCRGTIRRDVVVQSITVPDNDQELLVPDFHGVPPSAEACGNELVFVVRNPNEEGMTEIWRSRYPDSGFELADVISGGTYVDDSLGSRKDYYYKLRAVTTTDTSAFSDTHKFSSGAQWFEPTLELTVLPDNTVQGKLTDRSYFDDSYEVYRIHDFNSSVALTDSGRVHTFVDTFVQPGESYTYHVDLYYCYVDLRRDVIVKSITLPPADAENMAARISVYPNPVADHATVNITGAPHGPAQIMLIDSQGKTHFSKMETLPETGQLSREIDLQDLRSGLYYMQIRLNNKSVSETVMITD